MSAEIFGFNTCPCLREGSYVYVTSSAFVGKLDLDKGEYVWSHELRNKFKSISALGLPRIDGNKVIFPEGSNGHPAEGIRIVEVDKRKENILNQ
jgi:hypothetical protein